MLIQTCCCVSWLCIYVQGQTLPLHDFGDLIATIFVHAPSIVCVTNIWMVVALVSILPSNAACARFLRMVSWQVNTFSSTSLQIGILYSNHMVDIQHVFDHTICKQAISWEIMYVPHTHCFQGELCTPHMHQMNQHISTILAVLHLGVVNRHQHY